MNPLVLTGDHILTEDTPQAVVIKNMKDLCDGYNLQDSDFQTLPYKLGVGQQQTCKKKISYVGLLPHVKEIIWSHYNKQEAQKKQRFLNLYQTRTDVNLLKEARKLALLGKIKSAFVTNTHMTGILTKDSPPSMS